MASFRCDPVRISVKAAGPPPVRRLHEIFIPESIQRGHPFFGVPGYRRGLSGKGRRMGTNRTRVSDQSFAPITFA